MSSLPASEMAPPMASTPLPADVGRPAPIEVPRSVEVEAAPASTPTPLVAPNTTNAAVVSPQNRNAPALQRFDFLPQAAFRRVRLFRVLLTTWFSYAAYCMARRPFAVARATIAADIGLSVADCVVMDTTFLLFYTIGQLIYGPLQKNLKFSARDLLFYGLAGSAVSLVALTAVANLWQGVIVWAFLGLVQAVGWSSCLVVVTPWLAMGERGTVMGVWGTMAAAGAVAGNMLMPAFMTLFGSWRIALIVISIIIVSTDFFTRFFVARHPNVYGFVAPNQEQLGVSSVESLSRPGSRVSSEGEILPPSSSPEDTERGTTTPPHQNKVPEIPVSELIRRPGVLSICSSYFCTKLVRYVLSLWLPYYFTVILGHSTQVAGIMASVFDIGGVVGSILSGYASDWFDGGRRRTEFCIWIAVTITGALGGFSFGSALAVNIYYASLVSFCLGACVYANDTLVMGPLLQDFSERSHLTSSLGALGGLVGGIGTLGSVLQGPLTAFVTSFSWPALFFTLQAISLVGGLVLIPPCRIERMASRAARDALNTSRRN